MFKRSAKTKIAIFILIGVALWAAGYKIAHKMHEIRLKVLAKQVGAYYSAVHSFHDMYRAIPGDFKQADKINGCGLVCKPWPENADNGIIGRQSLTWKSHTPIRTSVPATSEEDETIAFWNQLLHANLLGLVAANLQNGIPVAWNVTHPSAYGLKDSGFTVRYWDGEPLPKELSPDSKGIKGNVLVLMKGSVLRGEVEMSGAQPLTPYEAKFIDKKFDDGLPNTGKIQAYGAIGCFLNQQGVYAYNEAEDERVCGLIFGLSFKADASKGPE